MLSKTCYIWFFDSFTTTTIRNKTKTLNLQIWFSSSVGDKSDSVTWSGVSLDKVSEVDACMGVLLFVSFEAEMLSNDGCALRWSQNLMFCFVKPKNIHTNAWPNCCAMYANATSERRIRYKQKRLVSFLVTSTRGRLSHSCCVFCAF